MNDDETDLWATSVHEAAHYVVSVHLKVGAWPDVWPVNGSVLSHHGHAVFEFTPSKFKGACVGWAGIVGEELLNARCSHRTPPPFPLTPDTLRDWFETMMAGGIQQLSDTDQSLIRGHRQHFRAFKTAWRILSKDLARVETLAGHLASRTRAKQAAETAKAAADAEAKWDGIPRPPDGRASLDDFLSLVVSRNGDSLTTFSRFRQDDARVYLRWRGNPLSGVQPDEEKITGITNEEITRLQRDGFTQEAWLAMAKDYRLWQQQHMPKS